jgi:cysteine desulfurase
VGFAYIKRNTGLKPLIFGGSQERGYRAGTESFHNIVGLEAAMIAAHEKMEEEREYILGLKTHFVANLREAIPEIGFNGLSADPEKSTYTLVNVCLPFDEEKAMLLLFHLDLKGIACSRGSACQSGSNEGSHVLQEILSEDDLRKPSIRFSFSIYNTPEELDYVVSVLREFLED